MTRRDSQLVDRLLATGEGAPSLSERVRIVQALRAEHPERSADLDFHVLGDWERKCHGLRRARAEQDKLKELLDEATAPPWFPAVFVRVLEMPDGPKALVADGSTRRVVSPAGEIDLHSLACGDEVLLSNQFNVILHRSPAGMPRCGETALFDRRTDDGRLVLRARDEEVIVEAAEALRNRELKAGDLVRWSKSLWIAFEAVERSRGDELFLEETPAETFADIGGLDFQIARLRRTVDLHLNHGRIARKWRLQPVRGVLMIGPPGTGKTMLARAFANYVGTVSNSGRSRFMNVKPGQLLSMWYGQSEANFREAFRVAREAGEAEPDVPVVMFFDEVDSIAAARGQAFHRVHDRVMQSLTAEMNGLSDRGNVLVLASTNRPDAMDPALRRPGRFGDVVIEVPRPNLPAARDIFGKYLCDIPYEHNAHDAADARRWVIESAVSAIYAPNGQGELATIVFRDGQRRPVRPADLISGAVIANIARRAVERACLREVRTGRSGLTEQDVLSAISEEFETTAATLTPLNCRGYLADLPQDMDVVAVEPAARRLRRPHRYVDLTAA